METRPQINVDLSEYGMSGTITMEPLTFRRDMEYRNNIGTAIHYVGSGEELRVVGQDMGTIKVYSVLAFVTQAPFPVTLDGFMGFMDRADAIELGLGQRIFDRLTQEAERIKAGELSPFGSSGASPTGTSESS